jgi:ATP-dependent protease ClpP protease subunit
MVPSSTTKKKKKTVAPTKKKRAAAKTAAAAPRQKTAAAKTAAAAPRQKTAAAKTAAAAPKQKTARDSVAEEHLAFWRSLEDHEFYGPRVQHIYFYAEVTDASVLSLRDEVLAACRTVSAPAPAGAGAPESTASAATMNAAPKPIVIHINSPGGSVVSMQWLMSLFNQVHVPLCALIDGMSASAATMLSVVAPYRVGTEYSVSLLHQYSAWLGGRREDLLDYVRSLDAMFAWVHRLYSARTRLRGAELDALLRRDLWLDARQCLRLGIYDRVIRPDRGAAVRRFLASPARMAGLRLDAAPFFKTNWNRVYSRCDASGVRAFDELLALDERSKPVLYMVPGENWNSDACLDSPSGRTVQALTMIARVRSSAVPVLGIVDNEVSWWQMLPVLFCARRFMYENATLRSELHYETAWGARLDDIVDNATTFRAIISSIIKARARPEPELLRDLFDRHRVLTAAECLANGLVDVVVPLAARAAR